MSPSFIVLDKPSNLLVLVDPLRRSVYTADLDTGIRRNISSFGSALIGGYGLCAAGYNPLNNTMLIVDRERDAILTFDVTSNESVVLSQ